MARRAGLRPARHRARACSHRPRYRCGRGGGGRARDPRRSRRCALPAQRPQPLRATYRNGAVSRPAESVAGVILAAGEARRFGAQKLLAPLNGRALVQHVIGAANASSLSDVVLVVGADADRIVRIAMGRARVVRNPNYGTGQASSLHAGLRALADDVDAAGVLLGDVPGVTHALIEALIATQRERGTPAVISHSHGHRTPPALLHRDLC